MKFAYKTFKLNEFRRFQLQKLVYYIFFPLLTFCEFIVFISYTVHQGVFLFSLAFLPRTEQLLDFVLIV